MRTRAITFAVFICSALQLNAQKSFIGQTKPQVRDYWATEMSEKYFSYGFTEFSYITSFSIMRNDTDIEFDATFNRAGKCFKHSSLIKSSEIPIYKTRLKELGFTYSEAHKRWEKSGLEYIWRIDNNTKVVSLIAEKI